MSLTAEEAAAVRSRAMRPTLFIAAAFMAVITVLLAVAIHLVRKGPGVEQRVAMPAAAMLRHAPLAPAAVEPAAFEDDLPALPSDGVRPRAKRVRTPRPASEQRAVRTGQQRSARRAQSARRLSSFSRPRPSAGATETSELKRPEL